MFEQNKYFKWYFNIIKNAQIRNWNKNKSIYLEHHHIIPRSLNGSDDKSNMVFLTAKEHYICHMLLVKCVKKKYQDKMIFAFMSMSHRKNSSMLRYEGNSRIYSTNKSKWIEQLRGKPGPNKGKFFSAETKNKMSIAKRNKPFSIEHKIALSNSHKNRYKNKAKGYSCIKCKKTFLGYNYNNHFNICYTRPDLIFP